MSRLLLAIYSPAPVLRISTPSGMAPCPSNKQHFFSSWKQPFSKAEEWVTREVALKWGFKNEAGAGLWFPKGIRNNETDLLIRISVQSPLAVTREAWNRMGGCSPGGLQGNWQSHYGKTFRLCFKGNDRSIYHLCHSKKPWNHTHTHSYAPI